MAGVNKVILVGNLGADPQSRQLNDGKTVTNLSIATSETWKDNNGQKQTRTEWHKVSIFGKGAEIAANLLKSGSKVYIEGKLQTRSWKDQNGEKQYSTEIIISEYVGSFQILDKLANSSLNNEQITTPQQIESTDDLEDLPF
jgi:single-strand DNA-binding protein